MPDMAVNKLWHVKELQEIACKMTISTLDRKELSDTPVGKVGFRSPG